MRHAAILFLATTLTLLSGGCADRAKPAEEQRTIPAGKGKWVSVETPLALDDLIDRDVTLPYGGSSELPRSGKDAGVVTGYRAVFRAIPLTPEDRCSLELRRLVVLYGDGTSRSVDAHGYVLDNSDGAKGFRIELSHGAERRLVIPGNASATVYLTSPVTLPAP